MCCIFPYVLMGPDSSREEFFVAIWRGRVLVALIITTLSFIFSCSLRLNCCLTSMLNYSLRTFVSLSKNFYFFVIWMLSSDFRLFGLVLWDYWIIFGIILSVKKQMHFYIITDPDIVSHLSLVFVQNSFLNIPFQVTIHDALLPACFRIKRNDCCWNRTSFSILTVVFFSEKCFILDFGRLLLMRPLHFSSFSVIDIINSVHRTAHVSLRFVTLTPIFHELIIQAC